MAQALSARRRLGAVLIGGFCGTLARALLSPWLQASFGKSWPYDILLINVSGALVLALVTVLAEATFLIGPTRRLLITVGFLGAYTTFSSLALGDVLLLEAGRWAAALLYLVLSLGGGILAVVLGRWLGERCLDLRGRWRQLRLSAASSADRRAAGAQDRVHAGQAATETATERSSTLSPSVQTGPGSRPRRS
ncbi:fluoride efflux transporter CrcB [Thermogemmatispora sp.]|uniref:fluoride efflux transporter CrcB n=1 Tax=Thermogemmatispora sp. TaxID=1968838 RepID=UPI0035E3FF0F